ncbi:MAG: hypothetical protein NTW22_00800, partial [Proteobacteria bacterium]|nr:hypothetical protein [Pseudomonadota bacterium]
FSPIFLAEHITLSYLVTTLSRNLIAVMPVGVQANISEKWGSARRAIEANRWAYYQHMQYIPAAIAQAGTVAGTINAMPAIIKSAYILALPKEALKDHMKSIIAAGIPVDVPQAQAKLHSIMTLLLSQYNIASLLPEGREIADVQKFVEFVVEPVPALYRAPGVRDVTLEQVYRGQTGEQLRIFVAHLIRVRPAAAAAAAEEEINEDIAQVVFSSVALVRQHQATAYAADKIVIPYEILPVYLSAAVEVGLVSPDKSSKKTSSSGGFSPVPKGRAHIVVSGKTAFEREGVYETIKMGELADSFVSLSFYEITDILKCFASYLDVVKRDLHEVDPIKGPYTGNMLSRTYLSEVLSIRYRILAGDRTADLNQALTFINRCRADFINSMDGRGLFGKNKAVRGAAGGDRVDRKLNFGDH